MWECDSLAPLPGFGHILRCNLHFRTPWQDQAETGTLPKKTHTLIWLLPLPFTPLLVSPGSTSLRNHLHMNPHHKVCFWRPKATSGNILVKTVHNLSHHVFYNYPTSTSNASFLIHCAYSTPLFKPAISPHPRCLFPASVTI